MKWNSSKSKSHLLKYNFLLLMRVHATNKIFFHPSSLHKKNIEIHLSFVLWRITRVWKLLSQFLLLDDIRKRIFLCKFDDVLVRSFVKKNREPHPQSLAIFRDLFQHCDISINKFYANCDLKKIYIRSRVRLQFQSRRHHEVPSTIVKSILSVQNDDSRKIW